MADISIETDSLRAKLREVNNEWFDIEASFQLGDHGDDLVTLHLKNTLTYLRQVDDSNLKPKEQANRKRNLFVLAQYIAKGNYPINSFSEERQPIFIDIEDNFCAVGHLLKVSGNETLARSINQEFRFSKLRDIKSKQLVNWQRDSGLSISELALIQPSYGRCDRVQQKQMSLKKNYSQNSKLYQEQAQKLAKEVYFCAMAHAVNYGKFSLLEGLIEKYPEIYQDERNFKSLMVKAIKTPNSENVEIPRLLFSDFLTRRQLVKEAIEEGETRFFESVVRYTTLTKNQLSKEILSYKDVRNHPKIDDFISEQ